MSGWLGVPFLAQEDKRLKSLPDFFIPWYMQEVTPFAHRTGVDRQSCGQRQVGGKGSCISSYFQLILDKLIEKLREGAGRVILIFRSLSTACQDKINEASSKAEIPAPLQVKSGSVQENSAAQTMGHRTLSPGGHPTVGYGH